jgi:hypothetical protein
MKKLNEYEKRLKKAAKEVRNDMKERKDSNVCQIVLSASQAHDVRINELFRLLIFKTFI